MSKNGRIFVRRAENVSAFKSVGGFAPLWNNFCGRPCPRSLLKVTRARFSHVSHSHGTAVHRCSDLEIQILQLRKEKDALQKELMESQKTRSVFNRL